MKPSRSYRRLEAIEEYRRLLPRDPSLRTVMARLLIGRNLSLAMPQRRWQEVDRLLSEAGPGDARFRRGDGPPRRGPSRRRTRPSSTVRGALWEAARDPASPTGLERWLPLIALAQREGKATGRRVLVSTRPSAGWATSWSSGWLGPGDRGPR